MPEIKKARAAKPAPKVGRRESNKADKLERIKKAALGQFVEAGFDDVTLRQIALEAGVGLGTIFSYAKDKRDLLFLTLNDEFEEITKSISFPATDSGDDIADQICAYFKPLYVFFWSSPVLGRMVLRELVYYDATAPAERFRLSRERIIRGLRIGLERLQADGFIRSDISPADVAGLLFSIYAAEIRNFLAQPSPKLTSGLAVLRRHIQILLDGIKNS